MTDVEEERYPSVHQQDSSDAAFGFDVFEEAQQRGERYHPRRMQSLTGSTESANGGGAERGAPAPLSA